VLAINWKLYTQLVASACKLCCRVPNVFIWNLFSNGGL
jgi:hypothetical protein